MCFATERGIAGYMWSEGGNGENAGSGVRVARPREGEDVRYRRRWEVDKITVMVS